MGSLNIDYVYRVPHFVQPGETISSYGREIFAGGKGLNQSIALARAGAQVIHGGMIGPDGAFLKELLEDSGVDTTHICTLQEASGHTVIQVDEQGQNCIILYAGTNHCVTKAYLDELLKDASAGDFMLIQKDVYKRQPHEHPVVLVLPNRQELLFLHPKATNPLLYIYREL